MQRRWERVGNDGVPERLLGEVPVAVATKVWVRKVYPNVDGFFALVRKRGPHEILADCILGRRSLSK